MTDDNIRRFLAAQWTYSHNKKTLQSSKSYVSWCLKENRLPGFIKEHEHHYKDSWKYFKNVKKDKAWTEYAPNAAESLTQEEVKQVARAPIRDRKGRIVNSWLRDKVAAFCLIHMGWHPVDCKRVNWQCCQEVTHEDPFTGLTKPALQARGVATKRPGQKVRNYWACGCAKHHNPDNDFCEYGLVKRLIASLGEERASKSLFWTQNKGGYGWSDKQGLQKKLKISECLERINRRVPGGVRPGYKLAGDMGRKTFATLGTNFFMFSEDELKEITHHKTSANFVTYVDPTYVNIGRETLVTRVFQAYEQGRYFPPMSGNVQLALAQYSDELRTLKRLTCCLAMKLGVLPVPEPQRRLE